MMTKTILMLCSFLALQCASCMQDRGRNMNVVYPSINGKTEIPKGAYVIRESRKDRFRVMRVTGIIDVRPCEFAGVELGYLPTSALHDGQGGPARLSGLSLIGDVAKHEYSSFDAACQSLPLKDEALTERETCWEIPQQNNGVLRMVVLDG